MADEKVILDPSELATGRSQLDITPWLGPDGVDWGDATVSAYMAEAARGEVPVDYRVPNRSISGGLMFKGSIGGTTVTAARSAIQQKLSLIQREGGWLKRITPGGGTLYADLTNASFRATSWSGWESRDGIDTGSSFELEAIPDFYENETTDSDNSTTTQRELLYTTVLTDQGDSPMRARIVVDNDGSSDWRGLIWAFRGKNYPGSTAATRNTGSASMVYEAESLGQLDSAVLRAGTAIYGTATSSYWSGGTVTHHGTLSTSWTPVLSTNIGGTTYLTHEGSYRWFARVASTSGTTVQVRGVWDIGDFINPVENPPVRIRAANVPYIVDLGEVRVQRSGLGTHRWYGQIEAKGDAGAETFSVDKIWLACTDEGMGYLTSGLSSTGTGTYISRSEFTTESGAIHGDSLTVGGTWTSNLGDATDFSVDVAATDVLSRAEINDASNTGHWARAGTSTAADVRVRCDIYLPSALSGLNAGRYGVFARFTDINNWIGLLLLPTGTVGQWGGYVMKRVSGSVTTVLSVTAGLLNQWYTVDLSLSGSAWTAKIYEQGSSPDSVLAQSGIDTVLASTGTLASGGHGIYDENTTSTAGTRQYDNFSVYGPAADAVNYGSRTVQLTTDGIYRQDSGGTAYAPVTNVIGDLPRFPVPPQSGGTIETLLIPATGNLDDIPDTMGTASISAQNNRRPSWLFTDDT